jgi:hypothetical protein
MGIRGTAPLFLTSALNEGEWPTSRPGHFSPGKMPTVPTREEGGWIPEPVWTLRNTEYITPVGNRNPAVQTVPLLNELSRLLGRML